MFSWHRSELRAARRYGSQLPAWLLRSFGASEFYKPAQIKAGIRALKLDPRFIDLGLAAYLPESEYNAATADKPSALPYEVARRSFLEHVPKAPAGGAWNPLLIWHSGVDG